MNVTNIIQALSDSSGKTSQSLFIQSDSSFRDTLTLGQVIKGKILRQYDSGKYLVDFSGEKKVVDSAVPLKTKDIITGRVVGIGEKIQLQKINQTVPGEIINKAVNDVSAQSIKNADEKALHQLFNRFNEKISPKQRADVALNMKTAGNRDLMALSALVVRKMGVGLEQEYIKSIYSVLNHGKPDYLKKIVSIPEILTDLRNKEVNVSEFSNKSVYLLAQMIKELNHIDEICKYEDSQSGKIDDTEKYMSEGRGDNLAVQNVLNKKQQAEDKQRNEWLLGSILMNVQSEGKVSHSVKTFPIWLGERVVEVTMAMFSQQQGSSDNQGIRYQKIVFSLSTELLGHVEISVKLSDKSLMIDVKSENDKATDIMSAYVGDLRAMLSDMGWSISDVNYQTVDMEQSSEVIRSVVNHYISQESMDQLM